MERAAPIHFGISPAICWGNSLGRVKISNPLLVSPLELGFLPELAVFVFAHLFLPPLDDTAH
jgi:hypothetical protein